MSGYIYMIGGYYSGPKYDAYQYHISSNTWSGMSDESISRPARVILKIWRNLRKCYDKIFRTVLLQLFIIEIMGEGRLLCMVTIAPE